MRQVRSNADIVVLLTFNEMCVIWVSVNIQVYLYRACRSRLSNWLSLCLWYEICFSVLCPIYRVTRKKRPELSHGVMQQSR